MVTTTTKFPICLISDTPGNEMIMVYKLSSMDLMGTYGILYLIIEEEAFSSSIQQMSTNHI